MKWLYWKKQPPVYRKNGVLKSFEKFTGKQLCQSLFLGSCRPGNGVLLGILQNFNRFFYNHLQWLLLDWINACSGNHKFLKNFHIYFRQKVLTHCKVSVWNALNRTPVGFRYYQIIANIGKVNIGICKIKCAE